MATNSQIAFNPQGETVVVAAAVAPPLAVPAPIMTSFRLMTKGIKDAKTRARVKRALGE